MTTRTLPNDGDLAGLTDAELEEAEAAFYQWVDGDAENGPRHPSAEDIAEISALRNERERRRLAAAAPRVRHPEIAVRLTGKDGNAFAVLGAVLAALRRAGVAEAECAEFRHEAMSGDYDHLLATCMSWVDVR